MDGQIYAWTDGELNGWMDGWRMDAYLSYSTEADCCGNKTSNCNGMNLDVWMDDE